MRHQYYILEGFNPVAVEKDQWLAWKKQADWLMFINYSKDARISTIFLGVDRGFLDEPVFLFETMIFGGDNDRYCYRTKTYEEAKIAHHRACKMAGIIDIQGLENSRV